MLWQLWTAFGIMLGYIIGVALWDINPNQDGDCGQGDVSWSCVSSMITKLHCD